MNKVTMMNDERQDIWHALSLIVRAANTDICINKRIWYDRTTCMRNNSGTNQGQSESGKEARTTCAIHNTGTGSARQVCTFNNGCACAYCAPRMSSNMSRTVKQQDGQVQRYSGTAGWRLAYRHMTMSFSLHAFPRARFNFTKFINNVNVCEADQLLVTFTDGL